MPPMSTKSSPSFVMLLFAMVYSPINELKRLSGLKESNQPLTTVNPPKCFTHLLDNHFHSPDAYLKNRTFH